MMRRLRHSVTLACLLAAGCATPPPRDNARTIKSLEEQAIVVVHEAARSDKQQAMDAYRAFVEIAGDDVRRMQAMRRIADLQLMISEEEAPEEARAGAGGQGFATAAELYRDLLRDYPDYPDPDGVLYQMARAYDSAGAAEQELEALDRLVGEYPASPYYLEAQFRRGEILFVQRSYAEAEGAYRSVIAAGSKGSAFYEQALYKSGWSLFKQRRQEPALDAFMAVLDAKLASGSQFGEYLTPDVLSRADRELVEDTLRVIGLTFSEMEGVGAVNDYFSRHGHSPYEHLIYSSLGQLYIDKERYTDAGAAFHAFVEHNPNHAQAPLYQVRVYEIYEQAGFSSLALEAKQDFIRSYGPYSPFWKEHDIARMPVVAQHLKEEMFGVAQRYHAAAQKDHRPADYAQAAKWYRDYLAFFPDDARAPTLSFLLAELLYEQGEYGEAIERYEQSAYNYPMHPKSSEAGYAALLAYERQIGALTEPEQKSAWRLRWVDSAQRFDERFPTHPQATAALTRSAEELFSMGDGSRALAVATRVLQHIPAASAEQRRTAWTIQGHVQFDRAAYPEAERAYQQALNLTPAAEVQARSNLNERLAAAIYKQGETARANGDQAAAARHFLRVGQLAPGASIAADAQYDAAAVMMEMQDWDGAIAILEQFRRDFPASHWQPEVTQTLAVAYLESDRLAQAADEFKRIGQGAGDRAAAGESLWQAAELYGKVGRNDQAVLAYQSYLAGSPPSFERAMEARRRLADITRAQNDVPRHQYWLREIVDADRNAGAARTDFSRTLAANASLELAEPQRDAYRRIALAAPLEKSLRAKKEAMQKAVDAYGKANEYGIAEVTTSATFEIGDMYRDFGRALLDSERPKGLSGDELEQYDVLLEEQAYPFEEEAIKLHEINYRRIGEGLYDRGIKSSLERLGELLPARYGKHERQVDFIEKLQ
ncbi:MAG: tetratricopeptide repeat protein [Gammaproteobacteria bacterium]|nr:tetratricopeptide repeat protein [Gammaproteobacteria bacterium]